MKYLRFILIYILMFCIGIYKPEIIYAQKEIKPKSTSLYEILLKINPKKSHIFTYQTKLQNGKNSLCIETTCTNDTFPITEKGYIVPVIKQTLTFEYNGIIKKIETPVKRSEKRKLTNGNEIEVVETEIIHIGYITGGKGVIYYIEGTACNACPELDAIYALDGELLWYDYSIEKHTDKQWKDKVNRYNEILKRNGIYDKKIDMISVLPLNDWNSIWKTKLPNLVQK